ncbi:glucose-6-phosphate isomerase family protein [Methanospirillum stamsii]|uniref:glucose-6-phosphate isomerase n=1 Tax=Methanospirillum stamsii TaxID=1277351 RepID=A0A2V2N5M4_9EURY|nr:glucose-6-phosphate isomerase family protein [Methanospirillum stamsii]PWR75394.1 glucose-6-phosphate isomerase [Methanospirillum stamsii]
MQTIPLVNPDVRKCSELLPVMADPNCLCEGPAYEMFRGLSNNENDKDWLLSHQIRYDITRIPGRIICGEWIKTKGHYHQHAPDSYAYTEIYEVLEGEALYLLQKQDLSDIILVRAHAGDLVLIPPGYGHVTINPSKETLLMANLVSSAFTSEYMPFEEMQGAAYYLFADGKISRNPRYPDTIPHLREVTCHGKSLPLPFPQQTLYSCIGDEKCLDFLNKPGSYIEEYKKLYLFT